MTVLMSETGEEDVGWRAGRERIVILIVIVVDHDARARE